MVEEGRDERRGRRAERREPDGDLEVEDRGDPSPPERPRRSADDLDGSFLDVRGTYCPLPVLLAERALKELPPGGRVTAVGDDPAIHGDVPAWCEESGHRLVELEELAGEDIRFVVEKAGGSAGGASGDEGC